MELSPRQLNRALLARQLLLERAKLPVPRAIERVGGLQTQYAPTAYIGLWSRLQGFERAALTRALERRTVIQGTLMRVTIHMVSAADYWPLVVAVREGRRAWWLRARKDIEAAELEAAAKRLRKKLAGASIRGADLLALAGDPRRVNGVGLWLDLVRVPPSGTWERRRADLYAAALDWLPEVKVSERDGIEHLVRRYLGGFGPSRPADIAGWAGLPVTTIRETVERMRLRRFRDEEGAELVDFPRVPLPPPGTPAPPRFIGTFEALLLVHERRKDVLPEEYRPLLFNTKTPHSSPTFLVDGAVAGTWRVERARDKATMALRAFAPLPRADRAAVEREAESLLRWHEDDATSFAVTWR